MLVVVATGQSRPAFVGHVNVRPSSARSARLKFLFHSSSLISLSCSLPLSLTLSLTLTLSCPTSLHVVRKEFLEYRCSAQLCSATELLRKARRSLLREIKT